MIIITIANLKGGVGKTVTAINVSYLLAAEHGKRVLLVDNDQQGNSSQFFGRYSYDKPSMSDVMKRTVHAREVIQHTDYEGLDIIPSNLTLAEAERAVMMDSVVPQQIRLRECLREVKDDYDYVIIDCICAQSMRSRRVITSSSQPSSAAGHSRELTVS